MTTKTAQKLPVQTILSGPAGGVIQSVSVASRLDDTNIITDDMGGTSTDVCLIRNLVPIISTENELEGFPIKIPQINIKTIGAGGGSIAWCDIDGSLQVGPNSSGAHPGPACYGKGGTEPTVTDANVLLNRLGPQRYLAGSIQVDVSLARKALGKLAEKLNGINILDLAEGIIQITVAKKTSAIKEISLQKGHDPRDFSLMAFGGAGPMHASYVAAELGIRKIVIPEYPGNFSALGLANCDLKHEFVNTKLISCNSIVDSFLASEINSLKAEASKQLLSEGFTARTMYFRPSVDMRYYGQAFEINIPISQDPLTIDTLKGTFHDCHQSTYGHSNRERETEIVNFRLTAFGAVPKAKVGSFRSKTIKPIKNTNSLSPVYFNGRFVDTLVIQRDNLRPRNVIQGPAIIQEFGATTVLPPQWSLLVETTGDLILEPVS